MLILGFSFLLVVLIVAFTWLHWLVLTCTVEMNSWSIVILHCYINSKLSLALSISAMENGRSTPELHIWMWFQIPTIKIYSTHLHLTWLKIIAFIRTIMVENFQLFIQCICNHLMYVLAFIKK